MRRLLMTLTTLVLLATACSSGGDVEAGAPSTTAAPSTTTQTPTTDAPEVEPACDDPAGPAHPDDPAAAFEDSLATGSDGCAEERHGEGHHGEDQPTDDAFADDMTGGGETHHEACDAPVTDEQRAAADELIAAVMAEVPRFATEQQALDAGYVTIAPPFAGHGAHLVNPDLFNDGAIVDPTRPESLVYLDGELEGVMFIMDEVGQEGPQPGGCLTQWHGHDDLCMTAPMQEAGMVVFLTDFGPCPTGSELTIPPPMLHVWVVDNPEGAFAGLET